MIKVEKCISKSDFIITEDGITGTFTKDEIYYARNSKNGFTIIKGNEGHWVALKSNKLVGNIDVLGQKFERVDVLYLKNQKELRALNI